MRIRLAAVVLTAAFLLSAAQVSPAMSGTAGPYPPVAVDPSPFIGTWDIKAYTQDGLYSATLVVLQGEEGLEGSLTYQSAPWGIRFKSATVVEQTMSFEFSSPDGYQRVRVTIDGDAMEGTSEISGYGTVDLEGTRRLPEKKS